MRLTVDLPSDLVRRIKNRAARENQTLKDVFVELIELGLHKEPQRKVFVPKPVKLRGGKILTTEEILAAIAEGRD